MVNKMELNEIWNVGYLECLKHPEVYVEVDGEIFEIGNVRVEDGNLVLECD